MTSSPSVPLSQWQRQRRRRCYCCVGALAPWHRRLLLRLVPALVLVVVLAGGALLGVGGGGESSSTAPIGSRLGEDEGSEATSRTPPAPPPSTPCELLDYCNRFGVDCTTCRCVDGYSGDRCERSPEVPATASIVTVSLSVGIEQYEDDRGLFVRRFERGVGQMLDIAASRVVVVSVVPGSVEVRFYLRYAQSADAVGGPPQGVDTASALAVLAAPLSERRTEIWRRQALGRLEVLEILPPPHIAASPPPAPQRFNEPAPVPHAISTSVTEVDLV